MSVALAEVYQRLRSTGPEFAGDEEGNNGLTNHAPMAAEVMIRRGLDLDVQRWLDDYVPRLEEAPSPSQRIQPTSWEEAVGQPARLGDWTLFFEEQLAERHWQEVLNTWWPRLIHGVLAGSTHGLIRVSHAVRGLSDGRVSEASARVELARGLAFWAARARAVPGATAPAGTLDAEAALAAVPLLPDQSGFIAQRLPRLGHLEGWSTALTALRHPRTERDVPRVLENLVHGAARRYLVVGYASPVLLVHTVTAPNAVLHCLPHLDQQHWRPSLTAVWASAAALQAAYGAATPKPPELATATQSGLSISTVLDRSAWHGDEHVIKLTDALVEAYERQHDPALLAAAVSAGELIGRPSAA